ncbi:hypothetical protein ABIC56_002934 [Acinetobacter bereziniae]|uniref:hypothetical protein n=1 Tax=Acinetobacter bereziniae TaxID=106648 RepID=UPI002866C6FB|nr:hypothetical protein [Acinetobacter bereziniae]MDR6542959.1 hypothetical protein [Acinetobacter bereziniae]
MNSLESETLIEIEKIKAKTAIAAAALNSLTVSASNLTDSQVDRLLEVIKKAQATLK